MIDYISLGSVVLLKGGSQKILVMGRGMSIAKNDKNFFFDYAGVLFPEGMSGDQFVYFNHENISKIVFEGYSDIDDENVKDNINRYLEQNPDIVRGNAENWDE